MHEYVNNYDYTSEVSFASFFVVFFFFAELWICNVKLKLRWLKIYGIKAYLLYFCRLKMLYFTVTYRTWIVYTLCSDHSLIVVMVKFVLP